MDDWTCIRRIQMDLRSTIEAAKNAASGNQCVNRAYSMRDELRSIGLATLQERQVTVSALIEQDLHQNFALVAQLRQQGRFAEALVCATRGLEQARAGLGENHPATAISLDNLAGLHQAMGEYETALSFATQAVAICRRLGGGSHLILASPLNQLGVIHEGMGNYAQAIPVFVESLAIKRQALGREHPDIAISLDNLAMAYKHIGDFGAAEPLSREALEIACQTLGADHPTTATILSNRATLCQETGDYRQAESLHSQALNIRRKVLGEQHPQVALSLDELALLYQKAGDYKAAEPFHQRALEIVRNAFGDDHPDVADCMSNLAMLYRATARYQAAEPLYLQALAIRRRAFGELHPAVAGALNNLALLYQAIGNYGAAEPLYQQSLAIERQVFGPEHPAVATGLDNLSGLCAETGEYRKAETLSRQALAIRRKSLGEAHPDVADSLNNLALLCQKAGNYGEVESLYRQALEIHRRAEASDGLALASVLNNLALFHRATGNYRAAVPLYEQALAIRRRVLGEEHPDVADSLNNLAALHHAAGDSAAAEPFYLRALAIGTKALGGEHPAVATFLGNLATSYRSIGGYDQAETLQLQVLDIRRRTLGRDHVDVALSLNELATLYRDKGDFEAAEPLYRQALAIRRATFGDEHPDVAVSLGNLASLCAATQRVDEALSLMEEEARIVDRMTWQVFCVSSEHQRMSYLTTLAGTMETFLSLVLQHRSQTPAAVYQAFDRVLRRKAIGAEALAAQRDAVLGGHYPSLRSTLNELTALRRQIARKMLAGPGPEGVDLHRRYLAEWNDHRERLEADLVRQIPEVNLEQRLRAADRHMIAKSLPQDSALVEFVRCEIRDFRAVPARGEQGWQPARYLAFVLLAGAADRVRLLDLGDAARIDRLIAGFRTWVAVPPDARARADADAGLELRAAVFDPLLSALEGRTHLFLALDGDLNRLPFEVLRTAAGRFLIDDYQIGYLSVGRDVLRFGAAASGQSEAPIVAASPDFDLFVQPDRQAAKDDAAVGTAPPARLSRALERASLHFGPLEGTRLEGERVAGLLGVVPWLEGEVLETRLKGCRSPRVLHLATHGFFLPNQFDVSNWEPRQVSGTDVQALAPTAFGRLAAAENPLLRSGLALAGVNTWARGGPLPPGAEDGLLTAEDVTGMDLLATELVVLSACETGLGDVLRGEGVFGLRRAFLLAGAKTVVMSLWQVPDEETRILMEDFYRRLTAGAPALTSRADALRAAQRTLRGNAATADPYFWGAFICEGCPGLPAPVQH